MYIDISIYIYIHKLRNVEKRWEEVSAGKRWNSLRTVEKSCEKTWEELRWSEKSSEKLRSGGHSWKGVMQDEEEFTEQSFEDVRLHANSYRQTLPFTPIV